MTTEQVPCAELEPAEQHLAAAVTHLRRACLAIKSAAQADPRLLVALGTKHAALTAVLRDLEPAVTVTSQRAARPANQAAEEAAPLPQLWMREEETRARLTVNALPDFEAPPGA